MNINMIIALNLKNLRQERLLSLGQLAELSGISKVMLSQIEKGETNPTINTIWKIANGLKVPYTVLIDEPSEDTIVITEGETKKQVSDDQKYHIACYYTNTPRRNFELFSMVLDEGSSYRSVGHSEKSQEYIILTEGELTLKVGNKTYTLKQGDSICFASANEHIYINEGLDKVKAVILNFYPI